MNLELSVKLGKVLLGTWWTWENMLELVCYVTLIAYIIARMLGTLTNDFISPECGFHASCCLAVFRK